MAPMAVVSSPGMTLACTPAASSRSTTASICAGVASGVITTIMGGPAPPVPARAAARRAAASAAARRRAARRRSRRIVTTSTATTASGNGISTTTGRSRPALMSSASPAPISTTESVVRSTAGSTRTDQWLPSHTPGTEPSRIVPTSAKSTLPATMWARPAAHRRIAAWNTSVPTTRVGMSRKPRIRPTAISAPLPAEVTPRTKPTHTPSTTAATLWRRSRSMCARSRSCMRLRNARTSVAAPVSSRATARIVSRSSSNSRPAQSSSSVSTYTPPIAAGTDPRAIQVDSCRSTVFWRQCLYPPTVLVTAA